MVALTERISDIGAADDFLGMTHEEMVEIMRPYVVEAQVDDAKWRRLTAPVYRRIVRSAARKLLLGRIDDSLLRTEAQVSANYSEKWLERSVVRGAPVSVDMPLTWLDRRMIVNNHGVRRLYMAA